jgi:hypothetical protein
MVVFTQPGAIAAMNFLSKVAEECVVPGSPYIPPSPFTYRAIFMANARLYCVCVVTGIMMQSALQTGH